MKKILKVLSVLILAVSVLVVSIFVISNLVLIIKIMFFGMTVGGDYPNTIWWTRKTLLGLDGIKTYYSVWGRLVYMFELPISIICIIYQVIYFKVIRKRI